MDAKLIPESIHELLRKAQEDTRVLLVIDGKPRIVEMDSPSPPETSREGRLEMVRYIRDATWQATGPGYEGLKEWVAANWRTERGVLIPDGTVATRDDWMVGHERQLDATTATKKLIAAAKLYGSDRVGQCADEYAAHGMIEVLWFYLMKGPPLETAKRLDDYCTLLPYREALRRIGKEVDPGDSSIEWPGPSAESLCALEVRYFERPDPPGEGSGRFTSPLLRNGPQALAHLLGLVWGSGFLVLGNWHGVPAATGAALPYWSSRGPGAAVRPALVPTKGYGPAPLKRPLAIDELHALAARYSSLTEPAQHRIDRAMTRLRSAFGRIDVEDRVIDIAIALTTLFMEEDEPGDRDALVPRRAAWLYADSTDEQHQTEAELVSFLTRHSEVVRGQEFGAHGGSDPEESAALLAEVEDVLQTSLKILVADGWPEDWDRAMERSFLRRDPPRKASEIPSTKSDSLSWSVEERGEIDRALEAVWKPVIDQASPPTGTSPTIISGPTPDLAARYRAQGIPYVVIHPGRLYVAHPKWPKAPSEPLDEQTAYYCERDVVWHTRRWSQAALDKGLVQFEVPIDAVLYHPKHAADWPLPLLSSHEEDPQGGVAERPRLVPVKAAESGGSTGDPHTEDPHRTAGTQESTEPLPELPESAMPGLGVEWSRLWQAFQHDVNVATNSLLYMLEAVHWRHLAERRRLDESQNPSDQGAVHPWPTYPKLRAFPAVTGEPLLGRSAPAGPMEQTLMRAWLTEVYSCWESRYRPQLRHEIRHVADAILPRQQVLGELGYIRNDIVHNNAIAQPDGAGRCEILQWFSEREHIQIQMRHIFDFLNQMAWLHDRPMVDPDYPGRLCVWSIVREGGVEQPAPALISVRPLMNPEQSDPRYRYEASITFENGVFGRTPMGPENEETQPAREERTRQWMKMKVDDAGNLSVPGLGTASATVLYRNTLKGERSPAPGLPSPWIQFRKDSG